MKSSKILLRALALVAALGFSSLLVGCDSGTTSTTSPSSTPSGK